MIVDDSHEPERDDRHADRLDADRPRRCSTVAEQQTLTVKAASGTYQLLAAGYGVVTIGYGDTDALVLSKLQTLFGFTDIALSALHTPSSITYTITFVGSHSGIDFAQLEPVGIWTLTIPAAGATVRDAGYGVATLAAGATAADVQAALQAIYHTADVTVTGGDGGPYTRDLRRHPRSARLHEAHRRDGRVADHAARAEAATRRRASRWSPSADGTTTPGRSARCRPSTSAGAGLVRAPLRPRRTREGVLQDVATGRIGSPRRSPT